jgi:hypothetical protein
MAKTVTVTKDKDGEKKVYTVVGVITSGSRGREFQLAENDRLDLIVRVCHAPMWQTIVRAKTNGETLEYDWS